MFLILRVLVLRVRYVEKTQEDNNLYQLLTCMAL